MLHSLQMYEKSLIEAFPMSHIFTFVSIANKLIFSPFLSLMSGMSHDPKLLKTSSINRKLSVTFEDEVDEDDLPPSPKPILKRRPTSGDLLIKANLKLKQAPEKPPRSVQGESISDFDDEGDLKTRCSPNITGKRLLLRIVQ